MALVSGSCGGGSSSSSSNVNPPRTNGFGQRSCQYYGSKLLTGKLKQQNVNLGRGNRRNLMNYYTTRNLMPYNYNVTTLARNHRPFLKRMNFMKRLPVHDGCVNTICWNKTGEYILSGSDDCNLCITRPTYLFDSSKDYTVLHKVPTRHLGNIFSARFMPNSGDCLTVSCSSEGPVILHDINSESPSEGLLNFNCHSSTIHEVVTVPDDDKLFLSCGEDKTIRMFDIRVHNSCARASTCPHPALIRNSHAMTTLTLHPSNSKLLLVGRADGLGLVYDRRKLPDVTKFSRESAHMDRLAGTKPTFPHYVHPREGVVSQFTVPDLDDKYRFTSLCYNSNGSEVLASYSGDYIYLFKHDKSSNFELIQTLPKRSVESSDQTTSEPGIDTINRNGSNRRRSANEITRIRVRGDWSDTGINSVPRSRPRQPESTNVQLMFNQLNSRWPAVTFWQHLTDVAQIEPIFIPAGEVRDSPTRRTSDTSDSSQQDRQQRTQGIIEEEETENYDDDDDDDNSTVVDYEDLNHDDDDDNGEDNDDDDVDSYERFADITVGGLLHDATEQLKKNNFRANKDGDTSSLDAKDHKTEQSKANALVRAKFRAAAENLKNKCNQIPTYHPRVKYQGHRNSRTSIKEAIFWGDDYIMSGSDCGRIMVWEKDTAEIVMGFPADERVVNCLSPNPRHYVLASSGIDYDIKLWSTQSLLDEPLGVSSDEMRKIVENNELMLEESKQTISVPPHLFFRVLASLAHSNV